MPDNYYDDGGAGGAPAQPGADKAPDEQAGGNTALLPKSLFGGKELKPGDTVTLKVSQVHEDEIAVEVAESEPAEQPQEQSQPSEAQPPGVGGPMSSMLE